VAQYSDTEKSFTTLTGRHAHNTQPWKVIIAADGIVECTLIFPRSLDVVDPAKRELHMSLGAFIENFHLAAGSLAITAKSKSLPTAPATIPQRLLRLHAQRQPAIRSPRLSSAASCAPRLIPASSRRSIWKHCSPVLTAM
jgi:hypothetical protein